jgi:hypothetical protein
MAQFKYTDIHIFNKAGNELPLVFDTNFKITVPNKFKDNAVFYGVLNPDNTIAGFHKHNGGGRYDSSENVKAELLLNNIKVASDAQVVKTMNKSFSSYSGLSENYSIDEVLSVAESHTAHNVLFPSVTFNTGVTFSTISTNLIETESLYIMIEEDGVFKKFIDTENIEVINWATRYKLLFFIDTRKQEDFRFFDATDDEIVWSNKKVLDLNAGDYRVDLGFNAKEEGIYEDQIIVCLLDTHCSEDELPGIIHPIGTIKLNAEAVGEDERYRALFTNFGLPHPEEYMNIFADTDLNEGLVDNIALNKNTKRMFLSYNEIFPYVGTYKALVNAVNVLGYTDVFFKEWYKETGKKTSSGNVMFDISYNSENPVNTINSVSLDERISLKKLNWLSMVYKINEELISSGFDQYGFPETIKVHGYNDSEIVVKLIALKEWLEKYIIGLNCRIIDVGGEGVYFERVRLDSYGSYQNIIEWNNEFNIAPYIVESEEANILYDASAYIKVNVGLNDSLATLETIKDKMLQEFCQGYIDNSGKYHEIKPSTTDADGSIFVGGTLDCLETLETIELKASSSTETFLFGEDYMYAAPIKDSSVDSSIDLILGATIGAVTEGAGTNTPSQPDSETENDSSKNSNSPTELLPGMSCSLRLEGNELIFSPLDLYNGRRKQTIFKKCPIILLEKANIRKVSSVWKNSIVYSITPDLRENTLESFLIKNHRTGEVQATVDYVTLIPPTIVEDNDKLISLKPYNSEDIINILPETKWDVMTEDGDARAHYTQLNAHYGLKYTAENALNIPMFSILGYQVDKIEHNISKSDEYFLEILDGKMMFQDDEFDRIVYLNFNYDTDSHEQTVDVNIVYNSEDFSIIRYVDSSTGEEFRHFHESGDYTGFAESYLENPEESIYHDFEHTIKVNNTGEFTIDVLGRDIHNNIFAANCDKKTYVSMPEISIASYTNEATSNGLLNIAGAIADSSHLNDSFIDFCLYRHNFLIPDISVYSTDSTITVEYPTYSFGMYAPKHNDLLHFVDITDRFNIGALDYTYTRYKNLEGKSLFETFGMVGNPATPKVFGKYVGPTDTMAVTAMNNNVYPGNDTSGKTVSDYLEDFSGSPVNYSDINLIFFNELGGYPIMQTYAQMASDKAFGFKDAKYKGDYRIVAGDESHKGYVWASVKDTIENDILASFAENVLSYMNTSNVWTYKAYYDETHAPAEDSSIDSSTDSSTDSSIDSSVDTEVVVEIPEITLGKDDEVSQRLAEHFIEHLKKGDDYYANNIKLIAGTDEYESFFLGDDKFRNDLYTCYDASYMPYQFEDTSANVEAIKHTHTFNLNGEDVTETMYYPYLITDVVENYDTTVKYPFKLNDNYVSGNLFYDVAALYINANYNDIIIPLTTSAYQYITTTDENDKSMLKVISTDILDASLVFVDEDTAYMKKVYSKLVADDETGETAYYLGHVKQSQIDGKDIFDISYTNEEEGVTYTTFRHMLSDYLNTPFEFNEEYISICIKAVYDVLSKSTVITTKTISNIVNQIYSELCTLDDSFKDAGSDKVTILNAVEAAKLSQIYYDDKDGLHSDECILKNFHFILAAHLVEMSRTDPEDVEIAQKDLNHYINAMFVVYAYFAVSFTLNIKNIVEYVRSLYPGGSYQVEEENIILYKYLTCTEYDIQSRSIVMMQAFVDSWVDTFLGREFLKEAEIPVEGGEEGEQEQDDYEVSLLYKYATQSVVDTDLYTKTLNHDTIGIYNKIVTNYSFDKFEEIAAKNWVTTGKVQPEIIKQIGISDDLNTDVDSTCAMYAVVSDRDLSWMDASLITLDSTYIAQIEEMLKQKEEEEKLKEELGDFSNLEELPDNESNGNDDDEVDKGMFYIKLPGYSNEGYKEVTGDIPSNFSIKIDDILASNFITTYVKPAWRSEIKIGVVDPTLDMYSKLDPNEQYLYAAFRDSNFNTSFKMGEVVKIIFESVNTKEYIGQSSYEIVGFDILNKGVILKGNINKDYLNTKEEEVWAKLDTVSSNFEIPVDDNSPMARFNEEKLRIAKDLKSNEFAVIGYEVDETDGRMHAKVRKIIKENSSYIIINPVVGYKENGEPIVESAIIPIKYEHTFDTSTGETTGDWYYRVHTIFGSGGIYPVNIASTTSEKVNMYISYSHISYVDYKMKVLDSVELPSGITRVNLESTPMNHRILDFIDDTFSVNISRFDLNEGISGWMNSTKMSTALRDSIPDITLDASSLVYQYLNTPVELKDTRNIAFEVNFDNTGIDASTSYVNWKIYKADDISANRKLLFESYNPMLFLDSETPGTYDVEAIVYDKFGNSTSRLFKGAYKIV